MARPERVRHEAEAAVPQPTPERKSRARHRRWASVVAIVAGVYAFGLAVWAPGLAGGQASGNVVREQTWWWAASGLAGVLALAAVILSLRSQLLGRVLLALGGVVLLTALFAFRVFGALAVVGVILPALVMLGTAPFLGPMPTPEEEGRRR